MTELKNEGNTTFCDVNEVFLAGRIVAIRPGRLAGPYGPIKFIRITLSTRTLSHFSRKDQSLVEDKDFPTVYWYAEKAKEAEKFQRGDRVTIVAYTNLVKNSSKTSEKNRFYQDLIGINIEPTMRQLDEGFGLQTNSGRFCRDENEVRISGTILRRYEPNEYYTIITLKSELEDQSVLSDIHCMGKNNELVKTIPNGEHVCLMGKVEAQTSTVNDREKIRRQRLVCQSITIA